MVANGASELAWELQQLQGALRRKPAEMQVPADSSQAQYPPQEIRNIPTAIAVPDSKFD